MNPVIPSSVNTVALIPESSFIRRANCLPRCSLLGKCVKPTCSSQRYILPLSTSVRLFPQFQFNRKSKFIVLSATGTDIAVEEANAPIAQEGGAGDLDVPSNAAVTSEQPALKSTTISGAARTNRPRTTWKSEMPPVKNEELVAGATFTGKVKSIQPFGAFIDFGAFTDGLVHVSQLSDSFVKDVGSIVSVGQEVKVRLVEVNVETKRISLSMRENDDTSKTQQRNDGSPRSDKGRPPRRDGSKSNQNTTKLVKGQDLEGTVKNLVRAGAFISLPDGEEGFLPKTEEADEGFGSLMGETSLQVGQEVSVRVLRIARGQATLTMKKEEANALLDAQLNQGVVHVATNPFALAFRRNKDIAAFLDEKEAKKAASIPVIPEATEETTEEVKFFGMRSNTSDVVDTVQDIKTSTPDEDVGVINVADVDEESDTVATVEVDSQVPSADTVTSSSPAEEEKVQPVPEENGDVTSSVEEPDVPSLESSTTEDSQIAAEVVKNQVDDNIVNNEVQIDTPATDNDDLPAVPLANENAVSVPVGNGSVADLGEKKEKLSPEESATTANISPALVKQLREETGAGMMDCKNALSESGGDIAKAQEFLRKKGLASADKKSSRTTAEGRIGSYIHDSRIGILIEVNCETDFVSRGDIFKELVDDLAMQTAAYPQVQYLSTEDVPEEIVNKEREAEMQKEDLLSKPEQIRSKIVDGRIRKRLEDLALLEQPYIKNDKVAVKDWVKQTIATIGENIKVKRFVRFNLGEGLEKKSQDFAAEVAAQTASKAISAPVKDQPVAIEATTETVEKAPVVQVSAALVKQLRDESGAGMMDCKKALAETGGDLEKAQEYLRKKGLSTADKKSSRIAAEGRIGSYIHDARIGVLIEVNCETDFVGRSEKFKELVDDLAMQVVASPQVKFVSIEDIPESYIHNEKEMEMQREDLLSKPENIREKIVDGRISKRLGELALLEQPFIKDDSVLVKDLVKQIVASLGENIKVRRFVRFTLGEN